METYTPEEVAKMLKIHRNTVYELIKDNTLKAVKIRRHYRIRKEDLEDFLSRTEKGKGRKPTLDFPL